MMKDHAIGPRLHVAGWFVTALVAVVSVIYLVNGGG
jgi:hypothetical protein